MENKIQIAKRLEKELNKWDFDYAIKHSNNETETRDYLIEPFLQILRYKKIEDYSHEYKIKISSRNIQSVDMVINISKKPSIFIECKTLNSSLYGRPYTQLSGYYKEVSEAKIGILTNGTEYHFYSRSLKEKNILHKKPFLIFDIKKYSFSDLEKLAAFDRQIINLNEIVNNAEESYFLEKFNDGLFKTLYKPKKELIKIIHKNMGFDLLTGKVQKQIFNLINSISIEEIIEKIKIAESKDSKSGILTTSDEIKTFDKIKTILALNRKLKGENLNSISYRDYKWHFSILVDNKPSKEICRFLFNDKSKTIKINKEEIILNDLSAKEIGKYKKKLIDSTLRFFSL